MKLGMQAGFGPGHIALDGDPVPLPKEAEPPTIFGLYLLLPNGREVGSALVTLCQMGTQLPLPPNGHRPQFPAHVYCGQTAGWIKMPLGRELGLDPATLC